MNKDFFIMLNTPNGGIVPLEKEEDNFDVLATFETYEEARINARKNTLGAIFGYEIFERGMGDT